MIMNNSRDKNVQAKQEGETTTTDQNINMFSSRASSTTTRQWGGFKNPRIVRVSRTFGGKDRHSKVCTVRGLRDRRIRLSVPTAIQLYDLQDRLGLNQPSKVVDWLLDETKDDIDKLPPLQMPPGNFSQFHHQPASLFSQESSSMAAPQASLSHFFHANSSTIKDENTQKGININNHFDGNDHQTSLGRSRETGLENNYGGYVAQLSAQNFFPGTNNQSSFPGVLNNNTLPYNPYFHWEPSNLSLSQFGNHSLTFQQAEDHSQNHHSLSFPSSIPIASGSQLYFCPSVTTVPSIVPTYPPYMNTTTVENDSRQINHLQLLSSSSSSQHAQPSNFLMPTLHLMSSPMTLNATSRAPKLPPSQENDDMNEGDNS